MEFGYDPARGIFLPPETGRYKAGPNPTSKPPLDPIWTRKLERIADRIGAPLRWHWMGEDFTHGAPARIWGIQQKGERGWQTVFCWYDENGQHPGNHFPFLPVDDRALKEFCESSLRIRFDTGDEDKDLRLSHAAADAHKQARKERSDVKQTELIANVIAGGDTKRFGRLLAHEEMHAGPGVRFTEFFTGADLGGGGGE